MAAELLCLFKSSRRTEYTQENLRILSGAIGDVVEAAYKDRWLSDDVRQRLPHAGEAVLISLADPPYTKSQPIRRAEVAAVAFVDDTLRLELRLGPRIAVDMNRWKPLVQSGPNPLTGAFAVRLSVADDSIEELTDPERELKAWKRQIDAVSNADGYARVAFLRVGAVSEVGGTPLERPYRLARERTYELDLLAYNPHLEARTLEALHLVPFPDPTVVDVAMDDQPIPADGTIELALDPQEEGPASLEFNVARGAEFWYALHFEWTTIAPVVIEQPGTVTPAPDLTDARAEPVAEVEAPQVRSPAGVHLLRAYQLLRGHHPVPPAIRIRLLDELLKAAPGNERLLEQRGIVLHELRQWQEAASLLDDLPSGVLSPEGRTVLVASWFMQGALPEPIDRITIADLSRDEWFTMLHEASRRLTAEEQVAVAQLLAKAVLAEDRASRWIAPLATNGELPRRDRLALFEIWQYADPAAAAAGLEGLVESRAVDLADPEFATIALDLGLDGHRIRLARQAAFALSAHHAEGADVANLEALLDLVMSRFDRQARREIGEEIVLAIADVADDEDDIDRAVDAAADLIEDQRQRGDLDAAARLALFVRSNEHRVGDQVRRHYEAVLAQLDDAFDRSSAIIKYREARDRELNLDLIGTVGGKRVLVVGANEQPWWPDIRAEFGFHIGSEWVSTEKRKSPDLDRLIKKLDKVDLLVVQIGRIGHKTSEPLMRAAKDRHVQTITVPQPTRDQFTLALRAGLVKLDAA